jgi:hypothetical protein
MNGLTIRQGLLIVAALTAVAACSTASPQVKSAGSSAASRDSEAGAHAPLQAACEVTDRSVGACTLTTVPVGYRFVIETVDRAIGSWPTLLTTLSGVAQWHWLAREFVGTDATLKLGVYMLTHHLRLYADPGTPVVVETADALGSFTVSGYLVRLP